MIRPQLATIILLAILATAAEGYERTTHQSLANAAALASTLGSGTTLKRIGLIFPIDSYRPGQTFAGSKDGPKSILNLITSGADWEDDFPPGPIYHFFNPQTNRPLELSPVDYPDVPPSRLEKINALMGTSPDWVVRGTGSQPDFIPAALWPWAENKSALPKVRDYFYQALTAPTLRERNANFGLLFESIGRAIHHLQDMAQPQHVRNDSHLSHPIPDSLCSWSSDIADICKTYSAIRRASAYEEWTNRGDVLPSLPMEGYAPVYPGVGSVPDGIDVFSAPELFWLNSGKGIAEYTNRNFFSAGTLDVSPPTTGVPTDVSVGDLCRDALPRCGESLPSDEFVTFFPSDVDDQFRPSTGSFRHKYAKSVSLFDPEFQAYTGRRLTSVNRFTFATDQGLLLPRAVGYSAGLINYFFRGDLEIAAPDDGVYAILDHTPDDTTEAGCSLNCGFRRVKLKLRNRTPNDDMAGTSGMTGKLVVVAKFHLNICYRPDLSGEFGGPGYAGVGCRSNTESIVVSDPKIVTSVDRAFSTEPLAFTFSAANPIPINATDLYLQVVYRGPLGQEKDAIAVATIDLSEPTYLTFGNHWDYRPYYNSDGSFAKITPDEPGSAYSVQLEVRFNPSQKDPTASSPQLDPGQFHRLAILTDKTTLEYTVYEKFIRFRSVGDTQTVAVKTTINQTDANGLTANAPPYVKLRLIGPTDWAYEPDVEGSTLYWSGGTACLKPGILDEVTGCIPVDRTNAEVTRRYPPFKQATPIPMVINF